MALAAILLAAATRATADPSPICPDRPSKSTGPCTVPNGDWQIETGLVDWTHDRSGGGRSDFVQWGNTAVKYGLSDKADVELWFTPLETLRVHSAGARLRYSSFGDTLLRVKYEITRDDAPVQIALDPFVKLPTASRRIGNGKVEGGLLVPIAIPVGNGPITVSLDPEIDLLADADGRGRHAAMQQVVNLGVQASDRLNVSAELWAMWDWDPASHGKQASADGAVAFLVTSDFQIDAGANVGLNSQTPDLEIYSGVSFRF